MRQGEERAIVGAVEEAVVVTVRIAGVGLALVHRAVAIQVLFGVREAVGVAIVAERQAPPSGHEIVRRGTVVGRAEHHAQWPGSEPGALISPRERSPAKAL